MPQERGQLQVRTLDLLGCGHLEKYNIDNEKGQGKYKHRTLRFIQSSVHSKRWCTDWVSDLVIGMGNAVVSSQDRQGSALMKLITQSSKMPETLKCSMNLNKEENNGISASEMLKALPFC